IGTDVDGGEAAEVDERAPPRFELVERVGLAWMGAESTANQRLRKVAEPLEGYRPDLARNARVDLERQIGRPRSEIHDGARRHLGIRVAEVAERCGDGFR